MPYMDTTKTGEAVNGVNDVIDTHGNPPGGTVSDLAGVAALIVSVNDLLIVGQFQSLALCIILTMTILIIVFKNWRLGVLTIIPCCIVVGLEPMVMVGMSIPLSLVTVMVGSIAIGTGVDFAIQISQRLNLYGMTIPNIHDAVENLGTSFVEATTTMVLGFASVLFAPWPGKGPYGLPVTFGIGIISIRQFVVMMMMLLIFNAIMALFVHSAILTLWFRAKRREELRQKRLKQLEKESIRRARAASMTMSELEGPDDLRTGREGAQYEEGDASEEGDDGLQRDDGGGGEGTVPDEEEEEYLDGDEELDDEVVRQQKEDDGYIPPDLDTDDDIYVDRGRGRGRGLRR